MLAAPKVNNPGNWSPNIFSVTRVFLLAHNWAMTGVDEFNQL